jgi:EmrB/QacA subfamily drug resistance transporter
VASTAEAPLAASLALAVLCTAQFVLQLDFSIINVALRTIERALGFGASQLQWVVTGYALTFGSLLLLGGRLGDVLGRRRLLLAGLWLFGGSSLACGLASSPVMLVVARLIQGGAAALMAPTILATLTAIYPDGAARTRALGIWTAATAGGASAGIVAGGLLTQYLGWRSIFLVNLPVIALLIVCAHRVLPSAPGERSARELDMRGAALVTLAIAALIYGLSQGSGHGFGTSAPIASFVAAGLLVLAFAFAESLARAPMVPFAFVAVRTRWTASLVMAALGGSFTANAYFLALYQQRALGYGQAHAAIGLLPGPLVVVAVSSALSGRVIARLGLKPTLIAGLLALGVAYGWFAAAGTAGYLVKILPVLVVNAIGGGLLFPAASSAITRGTDAAERGLAGSLIPTAQQIGAAVGLAVLATIAASPAGPHESPIANCATAYLVAAATVAALALLVASTDFRRAHQPGAAAATPAGELGG